MLMVKPSVKPFSFWPSYFKETMRPRDFVYQAIDTERDYQDNLGPDRTDGSRKTVGDYLSLLRYYIDEADSNFATTAGNQAALHSIRKVAGIAVRCMEEHGAPKRETS